MVELCRLSMAMRLKALSDVADVPQVVCRCRLRQKQGDVWRGKRKSEVMGSQLDGERWERGGTR